MRNDEWKSSITWCERRGYKWAIINNHFYLQTNYQTAEIEPNGGRMQWYDREYFDEITKA